MATAPAAPIAGAPGEAPDKDRLIVRQACLKAAAGIAAQLPDQAPATTGTRAALPQPP